MDEGPRPEHHRERPRASGYPASSGNATSSAGIPHLQGPPDFSRQREQPHTTRTPNSDQSVRPKKARNQNKISTQQARPHSTRPPHVDRFSKPQKATDHNNQRGSTSYQKDCTNPSPMQTSDEDSSRRQEQLSATGTPNSNQSVKPKTAITQNKTSRPQARPQSTMPPQIDRSNKPQKDTDHDKTSRPPRARPRGKRPPHTDGSIKPPKAIDHNKTSRPPQERPRRTRPPHADRSIKPQKAIDHNRFTNQGFANSANEGSDVDGGITNGEEQETKNRGVLSRFKDGVGYVKNKFASTFLSGNPETVNIQNSPINVNAGNANPERPEDFKCTDLVVTQPLDVPDEFLSEVHLQWSAAKPTAFKRKSIIVRIRSNDGEAYDMKLNASSRKHTVPGGKLRCGKNYQVRLASDITDSSGKQDTVWSDVEKFVTCPIRPKNIKLICNEKKIKVEWSACERVDKFHVLVSDLDGSIVRQKKTSGTASACSFDVKDNETIYFGREYHVEVVSIRGDLENRSKKQKYFIGNEDSPKEVKASIIEGTNKAKVEWGAPEGSKSSLSNVYTVETISNDGKAHEKIKAESKNVEIPKLKGGVAYFFRVAKTNGNNHSLWSVSNQVNMKACAIKVESFSVENSKDHPGENIDCSWGAVEDAEGYKIRCEGEDKAVVLTATKGAKSLTISSLTPKTKYQVAIKAWGEEGYGPYTKPEEIYTGLGTPTAVHSRVLNGNEVLVSFVEAIGASEHKIILSSTEDKEWEAKVKRGQTHTKFDHLDFNEEYWAVVTALYGQDESQPVESNTVLAAPPAPDVRDISSIAVEKHLDSAFTLSLEVDSSITSCQAQIECEEGDLVKNEVQMHINKESKKASFTYKGLNKGVLYRVKLRTENSGGYSEWSQVKLIKTAPKKIDPLTISFKGDKVGVEATWKNVRHSSYNNITLFEAGKKIEGTKRAVKSPFVFSVKIEHGLEYHCEIYPENATGKGRTTMSNVIIAPLLPPEDLRMFDEPGRARFEWQRSKGMHSAKIKFSNSQFEETEYITQKCTWTPPNVENGEVYTFTIWARNGKTLSPGFLTEKYVTAPWKVILKRNPLHPETSLDVEIVTNYDGPFLLAWKNSEEKVEASVRKSCFTIKYLKPSTEYRVHVLCIYGDSLDRRSQKCFSHKVMTLPAKVTGVRCICVSNDECKQLVWEGCGNKSVQYTLNWARNNVFFKSITTTKESWKFKNLEPGKYSFRVSAGGGKQSDECFITIPDAPQMELEVLSCQKLRVVFSPKTSAEKKYLVKIMKGPLMFERETAECELIVDQDHFAFEKGVRYTVTSNVYCGDQTGPVTKKECMLGLENPTEFKCELNHHNPHRPVKFTWKNSPGMFAAKIKLRDMDNRLNVEDTTSNFRWEYYGLEPNKTYEFSLWPGDGKRFFYDDCIVHRFTTAPNPPKAVKCKEIGETSFLIEIDSDYSGRFLTEVLNVNNKLVKKYEGCEKSFIIGGLQSNTQYFISVQCIFGENEVTRKTLVSSHKIKTV